MYLGVIDLAVTIAALKNEEKGLCRLGIVWSHLPHDQKGGMWLVLLIIPSYFMGCNESSL